MPNTVRTQPIWLPTGNPDSTNISTTDFNALGGQPGSLGQKFDFNSRLYQRVQLDSGATASAAIAPAANQQLYWKDKTQYLVTNDQRFSIGGSLGTNAFGNFVSGILRIAATPGNYIDILKKGDNIPCADGGKTYAAGETVINNVTANTASSDRIAVGTAPTFQRVGIARGVASGGNVNVDVDVDFEHQ